MTSSTTPISRAQAGEDLATRVLQVVRQHTLYEADQLQLEARLEGDLGIDSVVLAAILGSLRTELGLSAERLRVDPERLRDLVDAVASEVGTPSTAAPAPVATRRPLPCPEPAAAHVPQLARRAGENAPALDLLQGVLQRHIPTLRWPAAAHTHLVGELCLEGPLASSVERELALTAGISPEHLRLSSCQTLGDLQERLSALATSSPRAARAAEPPPAALRESPPREVMPPSPVRDGAWDPRSMKDFVEERSPDLFAKTRSFRSFLRRRQEEQLYWYGMPLESPCKNRAVIYDELTGVRREFLMFASNNYLGLANDPRVIDAICEATRRYGATNTGCRLIGGTNVIHKQLEERLAQLKQREACIVFPSGYSANLGAISALVRSGDAVVVDKLNHMSIVDGCRLSGAQRRIFQHNDMVDLERVLERTRQQDGGILIAVDGVFSMHGDLCNLPEIVRLARSYGARVLVDDAHATGVLGRTGSGAAEHFGLKGAVDLELGTMSKALGGQGGFIVGDADVIEYLRFYANSYVFAATIPAGVAAGLLASIDIMESEPERLRALWRNIERLKAHLIGADLDTGDTQSAIVPVVVGDDRRALELGRAVRARGMFCQTVVYPGVAVGDARLRISVTSEHTDEDIDRASEIVDEACRQVGVERRRVAGSGERRQLSQQGAQHA